MDIFIRILLDVVALVAGIAIGYFGAEQGWW